MMKDVMIYIVHSETNILIFFVIIVIFNQLCKPGVILFSFFCLCVGIPLFCFLFPLHLSLCHSVQLFN